MRKLDTDKEALIVQKGFGYDKRTPFISGYIFMSGERPLIMFNSMIHRLSNIIRKRNNNIQRWIQEKIDVDIQN